MHPHHNQQQQRNPGGQQPQAAVQHLVPGISGGNNDLLRSPVGGSVDGGSPGGTLNRRSQYFAQHSPLSTFAIDRETVIRQASPDGRSFAQTHVIRHEGIQDRFYTEEHWSSEIKSIEAAAPPKFTQVIKAYRVFDDARLTLIVAVNSDPPSFFEWFCNDKPVVLDRRRFQVAHAMNLTTLTVNGPVEGVYSCSATNPTGTSKSYGYITVLDGKARQKLLTSSSSEEYLEIQDTTSRAVLQRPPKFISQIPHLTLRPGAEALIDVEVESSSAVKFIWYVNGRKMTPATGNVEFYDPTSTRSIAHFKIPEGGQYTVIAQNEYGIAKSSAYIEIENDQGEVGHLQIAQMHHRTLPRPASKPGAGMSVSIAQASGASNLTVSEGVQRSASMPRTRSPPEFNEEEKITSYETETFMEKTTTFLKKSPLRSTKFAPQPPVFVNSLPSEITVSPNEKLVLTAEVSAAPPADIKWNVNGFEIRKSKNYDLDSSISNKSTLVINSPVKLGRYNATAKNDLGVASLTTTVRAAGKTPEFVETAIVTTSGPDAEVEIEAEGDSSDSDSVATVRNLDVEGVPRPPSSTGSYIFPQKPIIVGDPASEVIVPCGEPLVLDFKVSANPAAGIHWFQNNFQLKPSSTISIHDIAANHSRLIIRLPSSGTYRAVASNPHGSTAYEAKVFTEVDPVNEKLIFTRKQFESTPPPIFKLRRRGSINQKSNLPKAPRIVTGFAPIHRVKTDEPLVLDVEAEAIPEASFLWRVNNFEVKPNKIVKIERVDENRSRVVFLRPVEGRYEVLAQNYLGKDSLSTKVIVDYAVGTDNRFPIFVDALPAMTILAADKLEHVMVVVIRTSEPGTFRWFADGEEVESGVSGHEVISEAFKSTLIIRIPIEANTEYAVEFTNSLGIVHSKTTVMRSPRTSPATPDEKHPPRFVELLSSTAIAEGEVLEARVTIAEDTDPCEFVWFLKGARVDPAYIESSGYESILRIPDATKTMSGLLFVIAKNTKGQAESSMHFIVVGENDERHVKIIQDTMFTNQKEKIIASTEQDDVKKAAEKVAEQIVAQLVPQPQLEKVSEPPAPAPAPAPAVRIIVPPQEEESVAPAAIPEIISSDVTEEETLHLVGTPATYSVLVKVAETIGQSLAANIVMEAITEAAQILARSEAETEESEESSAVEDNDDALPPHFEIARETYNVHLRDNVTIHTQIRGAPCHTVEWYKDDVKLEENEFLTIISTEGHTQLVIKSIQEQGAGVYECRATNAFGCAAYQCVIHISDATVQQPFITDVEKAEELPVQVISINLDVHRQSEDSVQEVIVETGCFFEIVANNIIGMPSKKKRKRLSMESMRSDTTASSDAGDLSTVEEADALPEPRTPTLRDQEQQLIDLLATPVGAVDLQQDGDILDELQKSMESLQSVVPQKSPSPEIDPNLPVEQVILVSRIVKKQMSEEIQLIIQQAPEIPSEQSIVEIPVEQPQQSPQQVLEIQVAQEEQITDEQRTPIAPMAPVELPTEIPAPVTKSQVPNAPAEQQVLKQPTALIAPEPEQKELEAKIQEAETLRDVQISVPQVPEIPKTEEKQPIVHEQPSETAFQQPEPEPSPETVQQAQSEAVDAQPISEAPFETQQQSRVTEETEQRIDQQSNKIVGQPAESETASEVPSIAEVTPAEVQVVTEPETLSEQPQQQEPLTEAQNVIEVATKPSIETVQLEVQPDLQQQQEQLPSVVDTEIISELSEEPVIAPQHPEEPVQQQKIVEAVKEQQSEAQLADQQYPVSEGPKSSEQQNVAEPVSEAATEITETTMTSTFDLDNAENKQYGQKPVFDRLLESSTVVQGSNLKIKLLVSGLPIPEVKWTVEPESGVENKKEVFEDGVAILDLSNITSQVTVACSAKNEKGSVTTSSTIAVQPTETENLALEVVPSTEATPEDKQSLEAQQVTQKETTVVQTTEHTITITDGHTVEDATAEQKPTEETPVGKPQKISDQIPVPEKPKLVEQQNVAESVSEAGTEITETTMTSTFDLDNAENKLYGQKPVFDRLLESLNVVQGSSLKIKLLVSGLPIPEVTWSVEPESGVETKTEVYEDGVAILDLTNILSQITVACSAKNEKGSVTTSSTITVQPAEQKMLKTETAAEQVPQAVVQQPEQQLEHEHASQPPVVTESVFEAATEITETTMTSTFDLDNAENKLYIQKPGFDRLLESVTTVQGSNLKIKLLVSGLPIPEVTWTVEPENGVENITEVFEDGVAILDLTNITSQITVACSAKNDKGSVTTSSTITVQPAEPETVVKEIEAAPDVAPIIEETLARGDVAKEPERVPQDFPEQPNVVDSVSEAATEITETTMTSTFDLDNAENKQYGQKPVFDRLLESSTVVQGSNLKIKLLVSGLPTPEVKWTVEPEDNVESILEVFEDGVALLTLTKITSQITVACSAKNSKGSVTTSSTIAVHPIETKTEAQETQPDVIPIKEHAEEQQLQTVETEKPSEQIPVIEQPQNIFEAVSEAGTETTVTSTFDLDNAENKLYGQKPAFDRLLESSTVVQGSSLKIKLLVSGLPIPEVKWTVEPENGVETKTEIFEDGVAILDITNITSQINIACSAKNDKGSVTTNSTIAVQLAEPQTAQEVTPFTDITTAEVEVVTEVQKPKEEQDKPEKFSEQQPKQPPQQESFVEVQKVEETPPETNQVAVQQPEQQVLQQEQILQVVEIQPEQPKKPESIPQLPEQPVQQQEIVEAVEEQKSGVQQPEPTPEQIPEQTQTMGQQQEPIVEDGSVSQTPAPYLNGDAIEQQPADHAPEVHVINETNVEQLPEVDEQTEQKIPSGSVSPKEHSPTHHKTEAHWFVEDEASKHEPHIDETFEMLSIPEEEGFELVPREEVLGVPSITLTDEDGESLTPEHDETEVYLNVDVTKRQSNSAFELTILEAQGFIVTSEIKKSEAPKTVAVTFEEAIRKATAEGEADVSIVSPGFSKHQTGYKWLVFGDKDSTSRSATWVFKRESRFLSASPEADEDIFQDTFLDTVPPVEPEVPQSILDYGMEESSKLLYEVLSELQKSYSSTTDERYVTAREDLTTQSQDTKTADDMTLSMATETETSEIVRPPIFRQGLQDTTFTINQPAALKCIVLGVPMPEIAWSVDSDPIVPTDEYEIVYEDGISVLRFRKVIAEDEGEYVCEAFNSAGRQSTKCFVRVREERSNDKPKGKEEENMPLADSYILRKIKRLRTPSLGRSSKNSSNRSTPTTSSTPTSVGPSEVEESFIIHKYFDSKYLSHTLPTPRRIEGVYASAIAVPSSGHDIMNWSTPTASTELETVMHNQIDADSALLASDVWEEPIAAEDGQTTPTSTQPRTPELPDKIMYRGHTLHADQDPSNKGGRISPMMAYIESLCDFNNIFDEVNKSPKFATMPKENPDKQPKGLHHSASEGPVKNILAVPTIDESGRVTPLLLKSSNWRCKSSKVVELTQEWIISRDEEHLTVKGYFIPVEEPPKTDEPEEPIVPRKSVSPSKQALGQGDIDMLRHAIDEVQADLGKALELYQTDVANDVAEIEKAILAMSDQLARHKSPVSAAQAEVSEELLRTRFAEMILNMPHQSEAEESPPPAASKQNPELQAASANPSENYDLLKDPITALKDKLTNLERELVVDEEHSINEELRQIAATPQTAENYKKHKILRRRSENLARMTPLIYFVKDKLTTLEDVVEDNEEKSAAKQSGKTTPAADRKILHVLLWRINSEINNIHELCKKSRHMDSLNTVIEVLSKVCTHLDAILDTLRNWQKPLDLPVLDRVASSKRESREIGTGDADSIVNVNVDFKKDEEHEMTNTFVMFTSNSEKPSLGTNIIVSFTKTPEEQSATYVYNPEAESTTRHDRAGAYIQQSPLTAKRVMSSTVTPAIVEVPFIHLTAPNCSPSSSNANMEVSIHLRRRGDHQQASVELPIGLIKRHLKQFMTGDTNSVQMMCEESDATDTDTTSALFKGTFKSFHPNVGNVQEEEFSSDVMSFTSEDSPLPYRKLLAGQWKTFPGGKTPPLLSPTTDRPNETRSTHDREDEMSYVEITNVRNSWNENYTLSRRARGYKVNASIHPEVKAALAVTFLKDNYEVDIEKYSEKDRDSVVMLEEAYDQKAVRLPESPDRGVDREDTVTPTTVNEDDEPEPSSQSALITDNLGDLSVSVNAPRASDKIYVQVGEVPWGEATMDVRVDQQPQNDDISERSMIFNVMVSENQDEARSQGGSTKSLVTDRTTSQSSLNIPTYVIKHSSTASITCELNNYVNKATEIQWYKGTEPIPVIRGKFDRISHDLLEVLIINHITFDDTELYSIKVNNELYPVAYIIVEDANGNADTNSEDVFDTPNQTMFVMEGQEATFSCQTKDPAAKVTWYRDQELLEPCDRIHILSDGEGFHKVVIQDTDLSDQGTYYACYNGATSHITLVVEERIDEKEVAVSGPETDDEDLNDYLVPPGSTATIACELESTEFLKSLVWQRNNQDLIMNDKLEHVVNGNKHYLIIHNALPEDSGVYSVRINETQFKVAQITIIEGRQTLNTSKTKRISNNSLRSFESKDLYRI